MLVVLTLSPLNIQITLSFFFLSFLLFHAYKNSIQYLYKKVHIASDKSCMEYGYLLLGTPLKANSFSTCRFLLSNCHTSNESFFKYLVYNSKYSDWMSTISVEFGYPITLVNNWVLNKSKWIHNKTHYLLPCVQLWTPSPSVTNIHVPFFYNKCCHLLIKLKFLATCFF